jgi:hypothetical protein
MTKVIGFLHKKIMDKIKQMIEDGFCVKRISKILNISEEYIKNIIIENNISLKKEIFSIDLIDHIINLYEQGVSAKQLGFKYSIDKRRVLKWAEKKGILRSKDEAGRFTKFNQNIFDNIDDPSKSYWLGFFYADAYNCDISSTVNVSLKSTDISHLKKLSSFLNLPHDDTIYENDKGYKSCSCKMYSKHMCEKLTQLGCPRAKSFIIKYPDWLDPSFNSHFIRGMFDGDGCITCTNKEWKWSLVSTKECCQRIQDIISNELDFIIKYHDISRTNNNTYELEIHGNKQITKLLTWIYNDSSDDIRLDRKYSRFLQLLEQQKNKADWQPRKKISNEEKELILSEIKKGTKILDISTMFSRHTRTIREIMYQNTRETNI